MEREPEPEPLVTVEDVYNLLEGFLRRARTGEMTEREAMEEYRKEYDRRTSGVQNTDNSVQ